MLEVSWLPFIHSLQRNSGFMRSSAMRSPKKTRPSKELKYWLYSKTLTRDSIHSSPLFFLGCLCCDELILFKPVLASCKARFTGGCWWELFTKSLLNVLSVNNDNNAHSNSFSIKFYWKVHKHRLIRWCIQSAILNLRTHLFVVTKRKLLDRETSKENAISNPHFHCNDHLFSVLSIIDNWNQLILVVLHSVSTNEESVKTTHL